VSGNTNTAGIAGAQPVGAFPPEDFRLLFGSKLPENAPMEAHSGLPGWLAEQAARRAVVVKVKKIAGWIGTPNLDGFPASDPIQHDGSEDFLDIREAESGGGKTG
jgi:hypothetical protein